MLEDEEMEKGNHSRITGENIFETEEAMKEAYDHFYADDTQGYISLSENKEPNLSGVLGPLLLHEIKSNEKQRFIV
jgi:hypothetical protein